MSLGTLVHCVPSSVSFSLNISHILREAKGIVDGWFSSQGQKWKEGCSRDFHPPSTIDLFGYGGNQRQV